MSRSLWPLDGAPRPYAWGSPTAIPELLGIPPDGGPVAELWFDRQLPFLLKVLAADRALSIQVHPTLEQARAGFADEQARGIPPDAPDRNYRDANHKPELLCALTDFDALCGFRPVAHTLRLLDALAVAELARVRAALAGPDGLRAAFTMVLDTPPAEQPPLIGAVLAGCRRLATVGGEWSLAAGASLAAARDFPGDIGAVLALLLNAVRLVPGEAIFLAAGNVHAYLRGVGVEIMANSDNVLRCGLTPKHVDVAEVLRITDFTALVEPRYRSGPVHGDEQASFAPVPDFRLTVRTVDATGATGGPGRDAATDDAVTDDAATGDAADGDPRNPVAGSGPRILLCTDGAVTVATGPEQLTLQRGRAAFVAGGPTVRLTGSGTVYEAASTA